MVLGGVVFGWTPGVDAYLHHQVHKFRVELHKAGAHHPGPAVKAKP